MPVPLRLIRYFNFIFRDSLIPCCERKEEERERERKRLGRGATVGRNACGKLFCRSLENISEKSGIVEFFQHRD